MSVYSMNAPIEPDRERDSPDEPEPEPYFACARCGDELPERFATVTPRGSICPECDIELQT